MNEKCTWVFKMNWPPANQLYLHMSVLWFFVLKLLEPHILLSTLINTSNSCLLNQGFDKIKLTISIYIASFSIFVFRFYLQFFFKTCFIHLVGVSWLIQYLNLVYTCITIRLQYSYYCTIFMIEKKEVEKRFIEVNEYIHIHKAVNTQTEKCCKYTCD